MLEAAARSAGILTLLDHIISVEEVKIFKPSRVSTTSRPSG